MALLVISVAGFIGVITIAVALFAWFTPAGQDCQLNVFFVSFSLLLVFAFTLLGLHPEVNGSLLPSSVIGLYSMYLCWSALSAEPRTYVCNGLAEHLKSVSGWTLGLGMLSTLLSVVYSAVRAGSNTSILDGNADRGKPLLPQTADSGYDSDDEPLDDDDGKDSAPSKPVKYVYSFFHLIFALASMYSAMLLTGWGDVGVEGTDIIDVGWPSVWVKMSTQWVTAVLYMWSLVAPLVLTDREFF